MAQLIERTGGLNIDPEADPKIAPVGMGDFIWANAQVGVENSSSNSIYRMAKQQLVIDKDSPVYTGEDILKMHPDSDVGKQMKSTSTVRGNELELLLEREQERRERDLIIQHGNTGFFRSAVGFVAQAVPIIFDPVDIALTMGFGKLVGLSKLGVNVASKFSTKLSANIAEAVTTNVITEAAFVQPARMLEKQDADFADGMLNSVIAGVGFPVATGLAGEAFRRFLKPAKSNPELIDKVANVFKAVDQQSDLNLRPNVTDVMDYNLKKELPNLETRLDESRTRLNETPDDVTIKQEIEELETDIKEIKSKPDMTDDELRKRANSEENEFGYDPETLEKYRNTQPLDEQAKVVEEQLTTNMERVKDLEKQGMLDAADLKQVEEVRMIQQKASLLDTAYKAAIHCIGGK